MRRLRLLGLLCNVAFARDPSMPRAREKAAAFLIAAKSLQISSLAQNPAAHQCPVRLVMDQHSLEMKPCHWSSFTA